MDKESRQKSLPDDKEPNLERRIELQNAYEKNRNKGSAWYQDVSIRTMGELLSIIHKTPWPTSPEKNHAKVVDLSSIHLEEVNLSGISLAGVNLRGASLVGANLSDADLSSADLTGAYIMEANLKGADLTGTRLASANLWKADLTDAVLLGADLSGADLSSTNLNNSNLEDAVLHGANLRKARLDVGTQLVDTRFDMQIQVGDVMWNGVLLTQIRWKVKGGIKLGDELAISVAKNREERINAYRDASRAYRGLGLACREQGLLRFASDCRLREQQLERRALFNEKKYGSSLFSGLLELVAGYGERPGRAFVAYILVVLSFALAYFGITHRLETQFHKLTWDEALVFSLTVFHGRGFFPSDISLGDWVTRVAALEAILGLFIELILIATFSRRFLEN